MSNTKKEELSYIDRYLTTNINLYGWSITTFYIKGQRFAYDCAEVYYMSTDAHQKSVIDDFTYDKLEDFLIDLQNTYPHLINDQSRSRNVGYSPETHALWKMLDIKQLLLGSIK